MRLSWKLSTAWRITASTANSVSGEQNTTLSRSASSRIERSCSWMNAYTCSFGMNSSTQSTVPPAGSTYAAAR